MLFTCCTVLNYTFYNSGTVECCVLQYDSIIGSFQDYSVKAVLTIAIHYLLA